MTENYPTITADEARVGDTLRLTFTNGSTLQGKAWGDEGRPLVGPPPGWWVSGYGVTRIQRVQAAPHTLPTAPGSKIAYPNGETWTLGSRGVSWYRDGSAACSYTADVPLKGWVEVTTVPTDALNKLRERYGLSAGPVRDFLRSVDGEK